MDKIYRSSEGLISYKDQGEGDVIVLLHGYLESSEIFRSFASILAVNFRVITVDIPGHGKSEILREVHSMEFVASVVNELITSLNVGSIFLTGHSLSGYIALAFAELYPEKLNGYCLFHSHPFADSPEALSKRQREIMLVRAGKKDLMYADNVSRMYADKNLKKFSKSLERSKTIASAISGEAIIAILRGMMERPSRVNVMEKGIVPCLWILGAMDNYINCGTMQNKIVLPANAHLVILKESGHMGFIEEEERSAEVIREFIDSCRTK